MLFFLTPRHESVELTQILQIPYRNCPPTASFVLAKSARDADAFATMVLLASEDELTAAVAREGIGFARFNPATSELARTNFPFTAL